MVGNSNLVLLDLICGQHTTMAFNRLYKKIETLIRTEDAVPSDIPCKSDILSVRDCRKSGKVSSFFVQILIYSRCLRDVYDLALLSLPPNIN